jgi:hypothetical protein
VFDVLCFVCFFVVAPFCCTFVVLYCWGGVVKDAMTAANNKSATTMTKQSVTTMTNLQHSGSKCHGVDSTFFHERIWFLAKV